MRRSKPLGRHFAGTQRVLTRPRPVDVEADDVVALERSREQTGPLSPRTDAVPQPLVRACAVAARYRGERRLKVVFQQCQARLWGKCIGPGRLKPSVLILMAS